MSGPDVSSHRSSSAGPRLLAPLPRVAAARSRNASGGEPVAEAGSDARTSLAPSLRVGTLSRHTCTPVDARRTEDCDLDPLVQNQTLGPSPGRIVIYGARRAGLCLFSAGAVRFDPSMNEPIAEDTGERRLEVLSSPIRSHPQELGLPVVSQREMQRMCQRTSAELGSAHISPGNPLISPDAWPRRCRGSSCGETRLRRIYRQDTSAPWIDMAADLRDTVHATQTWSSVRSRPTGSRSL